MRLELSAASFFPAFFDCLFNPLFGLCLLSVQGIQGFHNPFVGFEVTRIHKFLFKHMESLFAPIKLRIDLFQSVFQRLFEPFTRFRLNGGAGNIGLDFGQLSFGLLFISFGLFFSSF